MRRLPDVVTPRVQKSELLNGTTVYVAYVLEEPGLGTQAGSEEEALDELLTLLTELEATREPTIRLAKVPTIRSVVWTQYGGRSPEKRLAEYGVASRPRKVTATIGVENGDEVTELTPA